MKLMILLCGLAFISIHVQAQSDLELEKRTTDKDYHFQEYDALQFEAINSDISTTTFLAKDLPYEKSPSPRAPMGNYKDFKIIKIKLPVDIDLNSLEVGTLPKKDIKEYLVKRDIKP
ncbi:hypothetical protein [Cyclobacterium plantarum]|uniref:Uncharacterized protein n=1 Tax=Cyclobacterium plantarum TaxID=2716263 RepID=A0ABX0H916_9BACT|nr:hypothetical protein [Cyclobacterium plantarum]NHE56716.1 hypothetical protein [Cyclobacterium plantarum]